MPNSIKSHLVSLVFGLILISPLAHASLVPIATENGGQWSSEILFTGSSEKGSLRFLKDGLSYALIRPSDTAGLEFNCLVWNEKFRGANPEVQVSGIDKALSTSSFLGPLGNTTGVNE